MKWFQNRIQGPMAALHASNNCSYTDTYAGDYDFREWPVACALF